MQLCSMGMCACAAAARVFKIIVGHLSYLFCAMASSNGQVSQQCLDLGVRDLREVCKKTWDRMPREQGGDLESPFCFPARCNQSSMGLWSSFS